MSLTEFTVDPSSFQDLEAASPSGKVGVGSCDR